MRSYATDVSGRRYGDLLSMLLDAVDENGQGMDDKQLRDEVLTLLVDRS